MSPQPPRISALLLLPILLLLCLSGVTAFPLPPAQTPPAQTPPAQTPPAQTPPAQTTPPEDPLSLDAYVRAIEDFRLEKLEVHGMEISLRAVPDLRIYTIAKEVQKGRRNGWDDAKIEAHLKKMARSFAKLSQRIRVRVSIEAAGSKDHLFLQSKVKAHLDLEGEGKIKVATEGTPKPRYHKWQIIQGASIKKVTLARFEQLEFDVTIEKKNKEVCSLLLKNLMHYYEAPRKNPYETIGINIGARQISLGNIADMYVDAVRIELAPATWKVPELPEELDRWLKVIDTKR